MYKYEMHIHTTACSACANSTAEEMVTATKEAGFSGLVLTNHFMHGNTVIDRNLPWERFAGAYAEDYYNAKRLGDQLGIDVLFGIEEGVGDGKEALIYGLSPEDIVSEPKIASMTLRELADFVHSHGGLLYAAHPFRDRPYIKNPNAEPDMTCYDSIEVYNRFNTEDANIKAEKFAKKNGLCGIAGGDTHSAANVGATGLAFKHRIKTNQELVEALKAGDFKFVIDGEIVD